MPARSVCLVTLSLSEAGPGRFGGQVSVTDIYHTIPYILRSVQFKLTATGTMVRLHRPLPYHTIPYHTISTIPYHGCATVDATIPASWYGMVDVCDGYLAAKASGSSFG